MPGTAPTSACSLTLGVSNAAPHAVPPTRGTTPGRSKCGSGIARSPAPRSIRRWRRTGSRTSGGTKGRRPAAHMRTKGVSPPLESFLSRIVDLSRPRKSLIERRPGAWHRCSSHLGRWFVVPGLRGGRNIRHFARATPEFYAPLALKLHCLSQGFAIVVRYDYVHRDRETVRPDDKSPVRIRLAFSGSAERSLYSTQPTGRDRQRSLRRSAGEDLSAGWAVFCDLRVLTPMRCSPRRQGSEPKRP
jgi:hypothetical protein